MQQCNHCKLGPHIKAGIRSVAASYMEGDVVTSAVIAFFPLSFLRIIKAFSGSWAVTCFCAHICISSVCHTIVMLKDTALD